MGSEHADAGESRHWRTSAARWVVLVVVAMAVVGGTLWTSARRQEKAFVAVEKLLQSGDVSVAIREVAAYQREYPDDSRVFALRARIHLKVGQPREAIRLFEQHGAASAADLQAWGRAYLMQSQWSQAAPILARFLQLEPQDAGGLYDLMVCNTRLTRLLEALELAKRLVQIPGYEVVGHLYLGTVYSDLLNEQQAAVHFAKVLELDPELRKLTIPPEEFLTEYGSTLVSLGKGDEAIKILKRSLETRPMADAAVSLGQAYLQIGETEQAIANWELAVTLNPDAHRALEGLADQALRAGNAQKALEWLGPLENSATLEPATTYLFQQAYQRLGDLQKAAVWQARTTQLRKRNQVAAVIDRLQVEAPNSYWAQIARAYRFAESGNWSEAAELLQQVRDGETTHPFVQQLATAVKARGKLPPLEGMPVQNF
ncbi:MAG: hypothetical protein FD138_2643 [Planctomycetota bacterium]|nr:MAG: hypothetical protein FD138_2643 [Planctomycetota bacterium]